MTFSGFLTLLCHHLLLSFQILGTVKRVKTPTVQSLLFTLTAVLPLCKLLSKFQASPPQFPVGRCRAGYMPHAKTEASFGICANWRHMGFTPSWTLSFYLITHTLCLSIKTSLQINYIPTAQQQSINFAFFSFFLLSSFFFPFFSFLFLSPSLFLFS